MHNPESGSQFIVCLGKSINATLSPKVDDCITAAVQLFARPSVRNPESLRWTDCALHPRLIQSPYHIPLSSPFIVFQRSSGCVLHIATLLSHQNSTSAPAPPSLTPASPSINTIPSHHNTLGTQYPTSLLATILGFDNRSKLRILYDTHSSTFIFIILPLLRNNFDLPHRPPLLDSINTSKCLTTTLHRAP